MAGPVEIRDPIHGFIELDEWERAIVNHPIFQRLRRIRQLGLTDMVYPGATHSRFEHSLGVMHVATKMFDAIVNRRRDFLKVTYKYDDVGLARDRRIVRLAALLHDVGHAPFSHTGEDLMPEIESGKQYTHEHYSAAIVASLLRDVIECHPLNREHGVKAQEIADFLDDRPTEILSEGKTAGRRLFWRGLVSGQLDADRADYLLRDSHHAGVAYGKFDLERLIKTLTIVKESEIGSPSLAIEEGGWHAAEGLIIARYMMFTQVYFHRARRAYDRHIVGALRVLLDKSGGRFAPPNGDENLEEYLKWDDWRVFGSLAQGKGGVDGSIIMNRDHDRCVFETPETPEFEDGQLLEAIRKELGDRISYVDPAERSWYKFDRSEILVLLKGSESGKNIKSLSRLSSVVRELKAVNQHRVYVSSKDREECQEAVDQVKRNWESVR